MFRIKITWAALTLVLGLNAFAIQGIGTLDVSESDPLSSSVVLVVGEGWKCTGTLISPDLVATAAHCILKPDGTSALNQQLFVHFGSIKDKNYSEDGRWMLVTEIKTHESFKPNLGSSTTDTCSLNDIALLKVDPTGVDKTFTATPIQIAKKLSNTQNINSINLYGISSSTNRAEYPTLRFIAQPFSIPSKLQKSTCLTIDWPADRFESAEKYVGLIHGDSGGPGIIEVDGEKVLAGVDSGGDSYTIVPLYVDWIKSKAQEMNATPPN